MSCLIEIRPWWASWFNLAGSTPLLYSLTSRSPHNPYVHLRRTPWIRWRKLYHPYSHPFSAKKTIPTPSILWLSWICHTVCLVYTFYYQILILLEYTGDENTHCASKWLIMQIQLWIDVYIQWEKLVDKFILTTKTLDTCSLTVDSWMGGSVYLPSMS